MSGGSREGIYNHSIDRPLETEPVRRPYDYDPAGGKESTLFVSNLPSAPEHRVRYLLEQLAGPMVVFRKEGSDGWLTYEDHRCAMLAHDILRDHKIEGIRLVVEVLDRRSSSGRVDDLFRHPPRELGPGNLGRDTRSWNDDYPMRGEPDRLDSFVDPYIPERKYNDHPHKRARASGDVEGNKLFVGNLRFETTKGELADIFGKFGPIDTVKLPTKDGKSTRYGFVHFSFPGDAAVAQREMNGITLHGRRIRVEISTSKPRSTMGSPAKKSRYDANPRIKDEHGGGQFGRLPNSRRTRKNKARDIWIRPADRQ